MLKPMHAVAPTLEPTAATGAVEARRSRVAEAWRIAMAHMQLGEVPIEQLDFADPASSRPVEEREPTPSSHAAEREDRPEPSEAEIDEEVDDSFPASDPPSWPKSHA